MRIFLAILSVLLGTLSTTAQITTPTAYGPGDVWVVVNKNMTASVSLGEYYCQKRQVPMDHILRLDLPEGEEMTRDEYDLRLRSPLKEQLKQIAHKDFILLTTYGVPIRVSAASPKSEDQSKLMLSQEESNSAVDSELAMLWYGNYPLGRRQINLRFFTIPEANRQKAPKIVMTCRIDGPTATIAKRLIDDALQAETAGGPEGFAYVDARGMAWNKEADRVAGSFGGFDESLRELAGVFKNAGFPTTLDNTEPLFPIGSCPRTALYCGWYSVANYIPSFELMTGSIAYHVASFEAVSLREANNKRWVPNLLKDGACVTIGPVWEPYLIAFPKPVTFFGFLLAGHTVVESYWLSTHFTSWQMMIIGDPLYRPFGKKPRMETKDVKLSPSGSEFPPPAQVTVDLLSEWIGPNLEYGLGALCLLALLLIVLRKMKAPHRRSR